MRGQSKQRQTIDTNPIIVGFQNKPAIQSNITANKRNLQTNETNSETHLSRNILSLSTPSLETSTSTYLASPTMLTMEQSTYTQNGKAISSKTIGINDEKNIKSTENIVINGNSSKKTKQDVLRKPPSYNSVSALHKFNCLFTYLKFFIHFESSDIYKVVIIYTKGTVVIGPSFPFVEF